MKIIMEKMDYIMYNSVFFFTKISKKTKFITIGFLTYLVLVFKKNTLCTVFFSKIEHGLN